MKDNDEKQEAQEDENWAEGNARETARILNLSCHVTRAFDCHWLRRTRRSRLPLPR